SNWLQPALPEPMNTARGLRPCRPIFCAASYWVCQAGETNATGGSSPRNKATKRVEVYIRVSPGDRDRAPLTRPQKLGRLRARGIRAYRLPRGVNLESLKGENQPAMASRRQIGEERGLSSA